MNVYLRHVYEAFPNHPRDPDDFVGPFPDEYFAHLHRDLYGPVNSTTIRLTQPPAPDHLMSPGEAADRALARY